MIPVNNKLNRTARYHEQSDLTAADNEALSL